MADHQTMGSRQSGRTARQIAQAPAGAVFVWHSSDLSYPKRLAEHLGRTDIKFMALSACTHQNLHAIGLQVIADHYCFEMLIPSHSFLSDNLKAIFRHNERLKERDQPA